jgi:hypothetical protein
MCSESCTELVHAVESRTAESPERDFNAGRIFESAAAASHEGTVMPVPGFVIVNSKLRIFLGATEGAGLRAGDTDAGLIVGDTDTDAGLMVGDTDTAGLVVRDSAGLRVGDSRVANGRAGCKTGFNGFGGSGCRGVGKTVAAEVSVEGGEACGDIDCIS